MIPERREPCAAVPGIGAPGSAGKRLSAGAEFIVIAVGACA